MLNDALFSSKLTCQSSIVFSFCQSFLWKTKVRSIFLFWKVYCQRKFMEVYKKLVPSFSTVLKGSTALEITISGRPSSVTTPEMSQTLIIWSLQIDD